MNYTENLGLKKPEGTDFYDVADENDNSDILDEAVGELINPVYEEAQQLAEPVSGERFTVFYGKVKKAIKDFINHAHSLSGSTITGTLPISKGGTGATSASAARTNLGAAAANHEHSASNITSGILPVARGGTGAGNAMDARISLQVAPANHTHDASGITSGILPVSRGGTGSDTIENALIESGIEAPFQISPGQEVNFTVLPLGCGIACVYGGSNGDSIQGMHMITATTNKYAVTTFKQSSVVELTATDTGFHIKSNATQSDLFVTVFLLNGTMEIEQ